MIYQIVALSFGAALCCLFASVVYAADPLRRQKARRWVWGSVVLTFVTGGGTVVLNSRENAKSREAGFQDAFDRRQAAQEGIFDPLLWAQRRLELQKQQASLATDKAVKQEADRTAQVDREAKQAATKAEKTREEARFKCLSPWDGSMPGLVRAITNTLRDPSSFGHDKTFVSTVNFDGSQYVTMQFRARNGFGGLDVSSARATINNATCAIVTWSMR